MYPDRDHMMEQANARFGRARSGHMKLYKVWSIVTTVADIFEGLRANGQEMPYDRVHNIVHSGCELEGIDEGTCKDVTHMFCTHLNVAFPNA